MKNKWTNDLMALNISIVCHFLTQKIHDCYGWATLRFCSWRYDVLAFRGWLFNEKLSKRRIELWSRWLIVYTIPCNWPVSNSPLTYVVDFRSTNWKIFINRKNEHLIMYLRVSYVECIHFSSNSEFERFEQRFTEKWIIISVVRLTAITNFRSGGT